VLVLVLLCTSFAAVYLCRWNEDSLFGWQHKIDISSNVVDYLFSAIRHSFFVVIQFLHQASLISLCGLLYKYKWHGVIVLIKFDMLCLITPLNQLVLSYSYTHVSRRNTTFLTAILIYAHIWNMLRVSLIYFVWTYLISFLSYGMWSQ
jgi:hypothetical protein